MRFSSADSSGNTRITWKVRPIPFCAITQGLSPSMRSPLKATRPASRRSTPVMQLNSVVLPEPFGPMRP